MISDYWFHAKLTDVANVSYCGSRNENVAKRKCSSFYFVLFVCLFWGGVGC